MQSNESLKYDVVIIGAGPAGSTCALALKDAGLKVALIDKHSFPRDKVCGDAIPGRAIKTLRSISPAFEADFKRFADKLETRQTTLRYKKKSLTFQWVGMAYTCARMAFDHFLLCLVRQHTTTDLFTETSAGTLIVNHDNITVSVKNNTLLLETKILIGADGAHSVVAKQLTAKTLDRDHHVGSVRAYFLNVAGTNDNTTEIYFDKRFLPSYLWIFPLPGNTANVGFGMLSSMIAKKKINIKKAFYDFVDQNPELKQRFSGAEQSGPLEGYGLPLGSKIGALSGSRFLLTGDAASLIDPASGDGIGNAMLSGKLAAEQCIRSFKNDNFTPGFMKNYDEALLAAIGKELKTHHRVQRLLSRMPAVLDVVFLASGSRLLKRLMQKSL